MHCRRTAHLSAGVQLQEGICRRVSGGYLQGGICRRVSAGRLGVQRRGPSAPAAVSRLSQLLQQATAAARTSWLGRCRGGIPGAVHPHLCIRPHRLCGTFTCLHAVPALRTLAAAPCTLHPRPRIPTLTLAPCLAIHWEPCAHVNNGAQRSPPQYTPLDKTLEHNPYMTAWRTRREVH